MTDVIWMVVVVCFVALGLVVMTLGGKDGDGDDESP